MYIYIFSSRHETHKSQHMHTKKLAIVTPFLFIKKGDQKIGDSNPFFIDKKGIEIFVLRAHGIPAKRRGLTEYGAALYYVVAVLSDLLQEPTRTSPH